MPAPRNGWRRLGPCIALTLVAHATLLALPVRPAAAAATAAPQRPLHARVIAQPQVAGVSDSAPLSAPQLSPTGVATTDPVPVESDTPLAKPAEVNEPAPLTAAQEEAPPVLAGWSLPGIADDDDRFVARSLLTVPPAPLAPVLIEYPAFAGPAERYRGELTLFIDEHGMVVRVRSEDDALPTELEEAARRAFMAVRFKPGELADQGAVKSRVRIEVVFEGGVPLLMG